MRINAWALIVILTCHLARGQSVPAAATNAVDSFSLNADEVSDLFSRGHYELTLASGVLFSPFLALGHRPTINYTMTEVQVGYMLTDLHGSGFLRGNVELAGEGFASFIFEGDGTFISGCTVWGRYNFVQPTWRVVPFAQIGLGLVSTDIDRKIVGQPFNFNIEVGVGARYLLSDRWAASVEFRYQHISNADTGPHNLGINAYGPVFGISYLF